MSCTLISAMPGLPRKFSLFSLRLGRMRLGEQCRSTAPVGKRATAAL
jgi:hypothetical protein